jgi:DNA recombination protein RmuC
MEYIVLGISVLSSILILIILKRKSPDNTEELIRLKGELEMLTRTQKEDSVSLRHEIVKMNSDNRIELANQLKNANDSQLKVASDSRAELSATLSTLNKQMNEDAGKNREELSTSLSKLSESLSRKLSELSSASFDQSDKLKKSIEERLENIRSGNETKLEEMRKTVDEKLHATLEKRLGESFDQVSKRLEEVHKGLGEMRTLATGVGDLKKALIGVKPRGVLGELQLENILEELLTLDQYEKNFKPNNRREAVVEFAIALPGADGGENRVYLPIDAKFPIEDYHKLVEAYELGNITEISNHQKAIVARIKGCARDIRDKYINPPVTTDFALLFLPFESLYGEVLRIPGLFEQIMREYNVILCGPTTISALLNSLQVGFKTLAIQKKSSEVWKVLAEIKKQFALFGAVLDKTRKKIDDVGKELDNASHRSRQIEKKLRKVEELPSPESPQYQELVLEPEEEDEV